MTAFLWFAVGLAVGVNVVLAGLWWSLRRENRKASNFLDVYQKLNPNLIVFDHTKIKRERKSDVT